MTVPLPIYGILIGSDIKTAGKFALTSRAVRVFSNDALSSVAEHFVIAKMRKCRPIADGIA
jgi:hypothetical protein